MITIASGVFALDPVIFIIASLLSRGLRFFAEAALWKFGPPIRGFIEKRVELLSIVFFVLLFGGFADQTIIRHAQPPHAGDHVVYRIE